MKLISKAAVGRFPPYFNVNRCREGRSITKCNVMDIPCGGLNRLR